MRSDIPMWNIIIYLYSGYSELINSCKYHSEWSLMQKGDLIPFPTRFPWEKFQTFYLGFILHFKECLKFHSSIFITAWHFLYSHDRLQEYPEIWFLLALFRDMISNISPNSDSRKFMWCQVFYPQNGGWVISHISGHIPKIAGTFPFMPNLSCFY